jgi:predicted alpha/beta-fold hydrolase
MMREFVPHPLVPGGHLQTLFGFYASPSRCEERAKRHFVHLDDGDTIVLHEDQPCRWATGDPVALLIHGLAGCHRSAYMQRIAARLVDRGVRTFRMDMRGCGAGQGLARRTTHCGRYADAASAVQHIARLAPDSPAALVGFSLGGAIALNLASELEDRPCGHLSRVLALCPPVDLPTNSRHFERPLIRFYDRFFTRRLWQQFGQCAHEWAADVVIDPNCRPRRLRQVDEWITAPLGGFDSADEYYRLASAAPKLSRIQIPTVIVAADDDPIVPADPLRNCVASPAVKTIITRGGGHLGYVARANGDPDLRWLDWRIVEFVLGNI